MSCRRCTYSLILSFSKYFSTKNIPCAQASGKKAFTLVELLVSVIILFFLIAALYKSYAFINMSNNVNKNKITKIKNIELKKETIYLDLTLAMPDSLIYLNKEKKYDIVSFMTQNSIHKRFNPYITYIVKESRLYRLETLKKIKKLPLDLNFIGDIDDLGEVDKFKIYQSKDKANESYLVNITFKEDIQIFLKAKVLSEKD